METESKFNGQEKAEVPPTISEATSEQDVDQYFAFANPELGVDWEQPPEEYTSQYIVEHPDETKVYIIRNAGGEIIAGGKVKLLGPEDRQRLGLDAASFQGQSGALLEYTVVKEGSRQKGLQTTLTEKRTEGAKEHDAKFLCTELSILRPIALYPKIRDGFTLIGIRDVEPEIGIEEPYFVAVKSLADQPKPPADATTPEWQEVEITPDSYEHLKALFNEGWVGIDMKETPDSFKKFGLPWILILEKR